ncbi:MAG: hypothetical protein M5U26_13885 [Planctomycetota bacterium]|nr:hypothetical protein [Planctomycetota bacterium]
MAEFVRFARRTDAGRHGRALEAERTVVPPEERDGALNFRVEDEAGDEPS